MPAAAVVVAEIVVADVVATAAAEVVAEAVAGTILADAVGETVATSIVSGAIGGATAGGVGAAATGGDVLKGVGQGALGGAVAGGVTSGLTGSVGTVDPVTGETVGASGLRGVTGSEAGGKALAKAAGGTAGGLATGKDLKTAAKGGLISAGVDYLYGEAPADASSADKTALNVEKGLTSAALNNIFNAPASYQPNQPSPTSTFGTSNVNIAGAGSDVGSAALGQALRLGDAGGPIFGGGDKEGEKQSGWNVGSLRYMGQES